MTADDPSDNEQNPPEEAEADEGLGLEPEVGSTSSLRSSILAYRTEHGRTYHAFRDGKYQYPNDDAENDRLDLQHHVFYLTYDGRLGLSPPNDKGSKVNRVLDAGCGTGIWAMDYGEQHPEAVVIGIDLSPIQPSFVPPNVRFEIDDLEENWTFAHKFDYIHSRMMTSSLTDWKGYLQKCYDNLEPGGYVELQDIGPMYQSDDGTLTDDLAIVKWRRHLIEAAGKIGRPFQNPRTYKAMMLDVGFTDVEEKLHKWPLNPWPKDPKLKELGAWTFENVMNGMEAFSLALLSRSLGWEEDRIQLFLVEVRKNLRDRRIHAYLPLHTVYGRKPISEVDSKSE